uniref:Uncharacterized protein n=1 Tax=Rhizophora mucronata TaxID=61149 RepID=A0A2P2Q3A9_RHIMU
MGACFVFSVKQFIGCVVESVSQRMVLLQLFCWIWEFVSRIVIVA